MTVRRTAIALLAGAAWLAGFYFLALVVMSFGGAA